MKEIILILGGTREASELADRLVRDHPDARVITSLAGRTREPDPVAGEVRIGGFGGVVGLAAYIRAEGVTRLIDATHPFARQISANANAASRLTGAPLESLTRPPWKRQPGDEWIEVATLEEACDAIPAGARVLLALGSQHIAPFGSRTDVHFTVRMVDPPNAPLPLPDHDLLIGKPGAASSEEAAMLERHAITHIVCRNSGGPGAYAKIEAARALGLPVIVIGR
ncbi:cobalt-precorrin-6A reductase [Oricola cellulosilytica]|uniref:Cobalt-precorrin-6A reductase n=1 Tax=Oricola cellulosilytica TaxID=1429082 RepID=A0A4R0PEF9_9HYPH|nr:cobalt-precorrin-6A reductase [Oricola cellulosilytica]TCD15008.1 cobalt-precorrin-6A reductase [Oricola cellulosilytica]